MCRNMIPRWFTSGRVQTRSSWRLSSAFGVGIGIGALLVDNRPWGWGGWGWNWGSRRVFYNPIVWGGWHDPYRPARPWPRPRAIVGSNRPGYGGDWRYVREIVARLILRITV